MFSYLHNTLCSHDEQELKYVIEFVKHVPVAQEHAMGIVPGLSCLAGNKRGARSTGPHSDIPQLWGY